MCNLALFFCLAFLMMVASFRLVGVPCWTVATILVPLCGHDPVECCSAMVVYECAIVLETWCCVPVGSSGCVPLMCQGEHV